MHPTDNIKKLVHDLRNELASIYTNAQILEMTLSQQGLENETKSAQAITRGIEKITTILTDSIEKPAS